MKSISRWSTVMVLALAALLLACEGESPTIPQPDTGGAPAPTGQATITLTASNANPLVNSISTITATVNIGNAAAPNGTAVEFSTNFGSFVETNSQSALRITNGGEARVQLTSATAGTATVIARVGAVTRTITVTFRVEPIQPPPPVTGPTITRIDPTKGSPAGNELVTITGTNFQQPVRVLFGNAPANVLSVTTTEIRVLTPPTNLGATEQRREVDVKVINQAGTPDERSATSPTRFTYELVILEPRAISISPPSGPNEGNTRITIFGEGFQPPTQVFFGTGGSAGAPLSDQVELDVISVNFDRIVAMTPPALGLATEFRDSQVCIRILNVTTNKDFVSCDAFRYGPAMRITGIQPISGTSLGGTRLTINGWGFDDPVSVSVSGVAAQPVEVTGTKIVAITGALLSPCVSGGGNVLVRNIEDDSSDAFGDDTDETPFFYVGTLPSIISVSPNPALPGQAVTIVVRNAGQGIIRFTIGSFLLLPTPATASNPTGDSSFTVTLPSTITFPTEPCTDSAGRAGTRFVPIQLSVTFTNITTVCTDTLPNGLTVNPTDLSCRVPPDAIINPPTVAFTGTCGTDSNVVSITVSNNGGANLTISSITSTLTSFQVVGGPAFPVTIAPGGPPVSFDLQIRPLPSASGVPPVAPAPQSGSITVQTNDPTPPPPTSATVSCTP